MRLFVLDIIAMLVACLACISVAGGASVPTETRPLFDSLDQNQDGQIQASEVAQPRLFARLLRTSDRNDDGQLSPAEFATGLQPQKPPKPMLVKQGGNIPGADALVLLIYKMDTNGDQRVEHDEVPEELVPIFDRIMQQADGDKNGTLDGREIVQGAPRLARAATQFFKRLGVDVEKGLALIPRAKRESLYRMNGRQPRGNVRANPRKAKQEPNPAQQMRIVQRLLNNFDKDEDGSISRAEAPPKMVERFEEVDANGDGKADRAELERIAPYAGRILRAGKRAN